MSVLVCLLSAAHAEPIALREVPALSRRFRDFSQHRMLGTIRAALPEELAAGISKAAPGKRHSTATAQQQAGDRQSPQQQHVQQQDGHPCHQPQTQGRQPLHPPQQQRAVKRHQLLRTSGRLLGQLRSFPARIMQQVGVFSWETYQNWRFCTELSEDEWEDSGAYAGLMHDRSSPEGIASLAAASAIAAAGSAHDGPYDSSAVASAAPAPVSSSETHCDPLHGFPCNPGLDAWVLRMVKHGGERAHVAALLKEGAGVAQEYGGMRFLARVPTAASQHIRKPAAHAKAAPLAVGLAQQQSSIPEKTVWYEEQMAVQAAETQGIEQAQPQAQAQVQAEVVVEVQAHPEEEEQMREWFSSQVHATGETQGDGEAVSKQRPSRQAKEQPQAKPQEGPLGEEGYDACLDDLYKNLGRQ